MPSMGAILEVKVLQRAGRSERSETRLRKGDRAWEGTVERICEPLDKNQIWGLACQGELARHCEALVVKEKLHRAGGCVEKDCVSPGEISLFV